MEVDVERDPRRWKLSGTGGGPVGAENIHVIGLSWVSRAWQNLGRQFYGHTPPTSRS
jgi:hypothetical protein